MVNATSTTVSIPKIDISEIDCKAGCCAKTSAPMPTTMVNAEQKMAVLCEFRISRPVRYLLCRPSIMKMLKSSPMPNMNVEMMMLMMLNSMPKSPIKPKITNQLTSIGKKLINVSSMRPYDISNAKKIRNEEV